MPQQKNGPGPKPGTAPNETATTSPHHRADGHTQSTAVPGHRRWRRTVQRMPRLDCGCRVVCHCAPPPLSDHQITAWADCARYVLDTAGVTPVLPVEVLRALYRRGGEDRVLAQKIHAVTGGEVR